MRFGNAEISCGECSVEYCRRGAEDTSGVCCFLGVVVFQGCGEWWVGVFTDVAWLLGGDSLRVGEAQLASLGSFVGGRVVFGGAPIEVWGGLTMCVGEPMGVVLADKWRVGFSFNRRFRNVVMLVWLDLSAFLLLGRNMRLVVIVVNKANWTCEQFLGVDKKVYSVAIESQLLVRQQVCEVARLFLLTTRCRSPVIFRDSFDTCSKDGVMFEWFCMSAPLLCITKIAEELFWLLSQIVEVREWKVYLSSCPFLGVLKVNLKDENLLPVLL
ncbi:hypothetical protein F2Q69_00040369 [Brassica cretica]|uniref:Uncharacterized protein n=1 Tax=Brassica cretica TaxID=69181 RepID=A0A8S9NMB3_BRACR|nr:hypothetical protein F2Q69_00040369 [Brassica cretica]